MVSVVENACRVYLGGQGTATSASVLGAFIAAGLDAPSILEQCSWRQGSSEKMTWADYIRAGIHPVDAANHGLAVKVDLTSRTNGSHMWGHPLNLAMMFMRLMGDEVSARRCIAAFDEIVTALESGTAWGYRTDESRRPPTVWDNTAHFNRGDRYSVDLFYDEVDCVCPDPAALGKFDELKTIYMNFSLLAWYADNAIKKLLDYRVLSYKDIQRACHALESAGTPNARRLLEPVVNQMLSRRWDEKRLEYDEITYLLRVLPPAQAAARVGAARGARALFGIALRGADSASMSKGLSALAQQHDHIRTLSSLYGRAPTVRELCSLRAKKLVEILFYMPQPLIDEVLEEDQAGERLRARLLREVGTADPTLFRSALTRHDGRATLDPYPALEEQVAQPPTLIDHSPKAHKEWDAIFGELALRYVSAQTFRAELERLLPNKYIRVAATLAKTSSPNSFLVHILETMPEWPEVSGLLDGFAYLHQPLNAEA